MERIPSPKTPEDWWFLVDSFWEELLSIVGEYIPLDKKENLDGKRIRTTLNGALNAMREKRDPTLFYYFEYAWIMGCPQKPEYPKWEVLGLLCEKPELIEGDKS